MKNTIIRAIAIILSYMVGMEAGMGQINPFISGCLIGSISFIAGILSIEKKS